MSTINGRISVTESFSQVLANVPVAAGQTPQVTAPISANFAPSTGGTAGAADQVDLKYTATLTFVTATPQVLNLQALTDVVGAAINFARVRSITIKMRGPVDGQVLKLGYSGVTSNAWTSLVTNPGQILLQAFATANNDCVFVITAPGAAGYVVGSTNRLLQLDPGTFASGTFTIDIEITGCSA